jgi:tRNA 2-(methylsulfanyl)-N6-isopentenyladenosine37 hydroxylase
MASPIASPCVGLCSTTLGDAVCRGCQRSSGEIHDWPALSGAEREARIGELDSLRETVAAGWLEVTDPARLDAQLVRHGIRVRPAQPPLSKAVELLRVGRGRIRELGRYGLVARGPGAGLDAAALHRRLSDELVAAAERRCSDQPAWRESSSAGIAMSTTPAAMSTTAAARHDALESRSADALLPPELLDFLACRTPQAWLDWALANPELLLIDHAQCEKKAASTAMSLLYRYVDQPLLLTKMSQLAREELLHFEQVVKLMADRGIVYRHLSASRYAEGLRRHVRAQDPERLVDILIIGAFIEARSCERFTRLIPHLDAELAKFYRSLVKSEGRHYEDYLMLARHLSPTPIDDRVAFFAEREAALIVMPDSAFRFHSGVPA